MTELPSLVHSLLRQLHMSKAKCQMKMEKVWLLGCQITCLNCNTVFLLIETMFEIQPLVPAGAFQATNGIS